MVARVVDSLMGKSTWVEPPANETAAVLLLQPIHVRRPDQAGEAAALIRVADRDGLLY